MIKFTYIEFQVKLLIFRYMNGFFGVVSNTDCIRDVFYGTDYHSHLGTKRAGKVFIVPEKGFRRSIHLIENYYFRTRFEDELKNFCGNSGLEIEYYPGSGEIVQMTADGFTQLKEPGDKMQICSFVWVYYGYPPSYYG